MIRFLPAPAALNADFEEYDQRQKVRLYKYACWFTALGMPAGFSLDMNLYPDQVALFLKLRLLSSVLALALFGLLHTRFGLDHYRALCRALPLIPQGFISAMIYLTEGALSPYYAGLCLILLAFCLLLPWNFLETLLLSLTTILFYGVACWAHGPVSFGGIFFNNFYFLAMTALFATIGSYFTHRLRVREFEARQELDRNRKALEESNRKLTELDQAKTRFFANISHELRTPLTLLISPLETLRTRKAHLLDEESREILGMMQGNAMRLLKLINDLLDLVKLESGRMEIRREPVAVEGFVRGLARSVEAAAADKRVELAVHVGPGLGTLLLDRDKVEKILLNLLFNGIKFTPAGGRVELTASLDGPLLRLKVSDTGMGIPGDQQKFLFQRFWQADDSARRKYQGTGLGLALVKELAEAHGGKVSAESLEGKGSTFIVELPVERPAEVPTPTGEAADLKKAAGSPEAERSEEWLAKLYRRAELFPALTPLSQTLRPEGPAGRGRHKVLVADDEPDMLRFLRTELGNNFDVLEAVDGSQAVEKARQYLPDLVLLDMMMPGKDGIEACRELKSQVPTRAIPVVLLTARADEETKIAALDAGANDFLTKPFSTTELHVRVENLVDSHEHQKELARRKIALEAALEQLKETEGQLVQSEKVASLGRLSAGIIHEINNPLNYVSTALHVLKGKEGLLPLEERASFREILGDIEEGVGRVVRIVSDMRAFTHPKASGARDAVLLEEVVGTVRRFFAHEVEGKVLVETGIPPGLRLLVNRNELIHVLVNLLQNSLDALKETGGPGKEGRIDILGRSEGGRALVTVRDNGPGIDPAHLDKVFDPFFTTKDVGKGMGLGLSICHRILKDQGGTITVKSKKGKFTEFTLDLPAVTA